MQFSRLRFATNGRQGARATRNNKAQERRARATRKSDAKQQSTRATRESDAQEQHKNNTRTTHENEARGRKHCAACFVLVGVFSSRGGEGGSASALVLSMDTHHLTMHIAGAYKVVHTVHATPMGRRLVGLSMLRLRPHKAVWARHMHYQRTTPNLAIKASSCIRSSPQGKLGAKCTSCETSLL